MKGKMAIIGDGDSVLVFKSVGIDSYPVTDKTDIKILLKQLAESYQIIFMTDNIAKVNQETVNEYLTLPYPIIISVPSKEGSNGFGMEGIKSSMEKALGIDLFQNENNDEEGRNNAR